MPDEPSRDYGQKDEGGLSMGTVRNLVGLGA